MVSVAEMQIGSTVGAEIRMLGEVDVRVAQSSNKGIG
jgi:hypothetical protein